MIQANNNELEYIKVFSGTKTETNYTIYPKDGRNVYVLRSTNPWSVVTLGHTLQKTTILSQRYHCTWATNGGPFQSDGSGIGVVISHQHIWSENYPTDNKDGVGFGLTTDGKYWVLGRPNPKDVHYLEHFVTGFDWLVRDSVWVNHSDTTGAIQAPRTAIGVDQQGRLVLIIVDGCEKCLRHKGMTLQALAKELIKAGVQYAVNMDGGGSSVLVHRDQILSHPTCFDVPIPCERKVATVFCIHDDQQAEDKGIISTKPSIVSLNAPEIGFGLQEEV